MQENIKQVIVKNTVRKEFKTAPIFQYDVGHVLSFEGFDLPEAFEVHFSLTEAGDAVTQVGSEGEVAVPDILVQDGRWLYAWLYISDEETGLTKFTIQIPVTRRARPTDQTPTPVEQSEIQQAIAALNTGVARAETAAENAETAEENASQYAENAYNSSVAAASAAESAEGDARTATQKAQEALTAALDADRKAQNASESAQLASQKASEASGYADGLAEAVRTANEAKQTAVNKANEANQSAENAAQKAQEALSSAQAAEGYANDAYTAKQAAENAIEAAQGYAGNASMMAQEATQSKNTAVEKAGEASQSADNAAQSAQAAQQTAQQFSAKVSEIDQELNTLSGDVSDLREDLAEHKEKAEETYAKQDGYYSDLTAGNAEQLVSSKLTEDQVPYKLRPAGGTNDIGNREYKEAIVGGTIAWNQLVRDEASENVTEFADVVTVTDAVEDAAGVRVKLEPVQDLHGYDHPWPGGGGKNLLDINNIVVGNTTNWSVDVNGDTLTVTHKTAYTTGTPSFAFNQPSGTYVVSIGSINITGQVSLYVNGSWAKTINNGDTFTIDAANTNEIKFSAQENQATIITKIQIESGSTATSYTPFSNICPITGWDTVKVTRAGSNINGFQPCVGYISNGIQSYNATAYTFYLMVVPCEPNKTYTVVSPVTLNRFSTGWITQEPATGVPVNDSDVTIATSRVIQTGDNAKYLVCYYWNKNVDIGDAPDMCVNLGNDTTYHAYQGQTYSIALPTEAGTVYGGELTVNADGSGSLVVDRMQWTAPRTGWGTYTSGAGYTFRYAALPSETVDVIANAPANRYYSVSDTFTYYTLPDNWWTNAPNCGYVYNVSGVSGAKRVWIRYDGDNFEDIVEGAKFIFMLQNPITYTLTASQITTLLGENNVWADTGDVALTYTGTDEHLTLESGKKYLARISGTDSMLLGSGQEITAAKGTDNVFNLTKMFGTAVADYVYGQGAAFFRKWFPNAVYSYNAGELLSVEGLSAHEMVGFNLWDEEWESGEYTLTNGGKTLSTGCRCKSLIPIIGGQNYYFYCKSKGVENNFGYCLYDETKSYIYGTATSNVLISTPSNARYMSFFVPNSWYGSTYKNDICINLAHNNSRNGEYEPYTKHSYPLDSSVILRGIPKTGSNGVYWDGDRYLPDGTVERKYGVVDFGTFRWIEYTGYPGLFYVNTTEVPFKVPASNVVVPNAVVANYLAFISRDIGKTGYTKGYFALASNRIYVANDEYIGNPSGFKSAMSGVLLVYELDTPTIETAQSYRELQIVDDWGTEEFVTTGLVPVGHETQYPANLRDKLQHLPDLASSNGIYIVKQTDSEMELLKLPDMPTANGNYRLKLNVASGSPTFSWEVVS